MLFMKEKFRVLTAPIIFLCLRKVSITNAPITERVFMLDGRRIPFIKIAITFNLIV